MFNLINFTMDDTAADEVFEITDKNYQRITENVEKVKIQILCFDLLGPMTSRFKF